MKTSQKVYLPFKRFFDIVLSAIALIVLSPLFLVVAVIIKLDSPGPVFYQRKCIGMNEKPYNMHKFRTMVADSDNLEAHLSEDELGQYRSNVKVKNDPRITKSGRVLRKTRIDELPQLLNVLAGEASLIGPRPVAVDEIDKYGEDRRRLLSVKPGLTGYWQVNNREDLTYQQRVQMQIHYAGSYSLKMDFLIFLKTFGVLMRGTGE